MPASVEVLEPRKARALQTWASKNRAQDRRNNAAFLKVVNCLASAGLLVAAGFWSHLGPFDLAVRFVVAVAATVAIFHSIHIRQFVLAGVFGALLVLYNPVAPVLSFSGEWQRAIVAASTLPFLASLWLTHFEDRTQ